MQMDDGEILREYKAAKNKVGEITILSQLNGCTEAKIVSILAAQGVSCAAGKPKKPGKPDQVDVDALLAMDADGKTPQEIAEALGYSVSTVYYHINKKYKKVKNMTKKDKPTAEPEAAPQQPAAPIQAEAVPEKPAEPEKPLTATGWTGKCAAPASETDFWVNKFSGHILYADTQAELLKAYRLVLRDVIRN